MSGTLLLWTMLALLLFWGVGLYNRLMRMRARGLSAFGSVEKHLREYADLTREQTQRFQNELEIMAAVHAGDSAYGWGLLNGALQSVELALKNARAAPLVIEPLGELALAMTTLQQVWDRLRDVPEDLAGPPMPNEMRMQWDVVTHRVETSRSGYNQILLKYNEALTQVPARLVVGLMGFKRGGTL